MLTKDKIINTITEFDNPVSIEDFIETIILLNNIEEGLAQSDNNDVVSESELDNEIKQWSK